jgi:hypothetical protein
MLGQKVPEQVAIKMIGRSSRPVRDMSADLNSPRREIDAGRESFLVRLDVAGLDDFAPALDLGADEGGEFGRR